MSHAKPFTACWQSGGRGAVEFVPTIAGGDRAELRAGPGSHEADDRDRAVLADVVAPAVVPTSFSKATTADWTAVMMMESMVAFTGMPVRWLAQTSRKPPASPGGIRSFRNAGQFERRALAAQKIGSNLDFCG